MAQNNLWWALPEGFEERTTELNEKWHREKREAAQVWNSQEQGTAVRMTIKGFKPAKYMHDPLVPVYSTNRAARRRASQWVRNMTRKLQRAEIRSKKRLATVG